MNAYVEETQTPCQLEVRKQIEEDVVCTKEVQSQTRFRLQHSLGPHYGHVSAKPLYNKNSNQKNMVTNMFTASSRTGNKVYDVKSSRDQLTLKYKSKMQQKKALCQNCCTPVKGSYLEKEQIVYTLLQVIYCIFQLLGILLMCVSFVKKCVYLKEHFY